MFVQTENTPNPNSLKFLPGQIVSNKGSFEITKKDETSNNLVRNLLSVNGVVSIFLGKDFILFSQTKITNLIFTVDEMVDEISTQISSTLRH